MLLRLKKLLSGELRASGGTSSDEDVVRLATASLFVEVSRSDLDKLDVEKREISEQLQSQLSLSQSDAESLLAEADEQVEQSTSLYESTRALNSFLTDGQKARVVEGLWRIAFADGVLHPLEEHSIRKIADLLYVPHREFIKARLRAEGNG